MSGPNGMSAPNGMSGADGGNGPARPTCTSAGPLRIVRLANFVAPASGGLRTALRELGKGYRAASTTTRS